MSKIIKIVVVTSIVISLLCGCKSNNPQTNINNNIQIENSREAPVILTTNGSLETQKEEVSEKQIKNTEAQETPVELFEDSINIEEYQEVDLLNIDGITHSINRINYIGETSENKYFLVGGIKKQLIKCDMTLSNGTIVGEINNVDSLWFDKVDIIEDAPKYKQSIIRVNKKSSYEVFTLDMELIEDVQVPDVIMENLEADRFRDWDVSNDFSMFTFSRDDQGLFLYETITDQLTLIKENNYDIANSNDNEKMEDGDIMDHPTFIVNDSYISTVRFGYEWCAGYNIYNIKTKNFTYFNEAVEQTIYNKTGAYIYRDEGNKLTYYDFANDRRFERGIEGAFHLSDYDEDYNYLYENYVVSNSYDYDKNTYTFTIFDLLTKEQKNIGTISLPNRGIFRPIIFHCDNNKVFVLVPWKANASYIISVDI